MTGIYKITSPRNKVYIGSTINFKRRYSDYKYNHCKEQIRLYNSLNKYGFNNHIIEFIEECSINELHLKERYWQEYYESIGINGLNCFYVETNIKKRVCSIETKLKLSISSSGKNNPRYGAIISEETRNKIGKSNKGKKRNKEQKERISLALIGNEYSNTNKYVINIDTGEEYRSIRKAALINNINYNTLKAMLSGKFKNNTNLIYK